MKKPFVLQIRCIIDNSVLYASQLWGEHGLSFFIKTNAGEILFDTGQSGTVLIHNARSMGIHLQSIKALVLSHGHYDHTGGLSSLMEQCPTGLPLYANPDIFQPRYSKRKDGIASIGIKLDREAIAKKLDLRLSADPTEILPGVWTTGEILERPEFEGRVVQHGIIVNEEWLPDPYRDDFSLIIEHPKGLILICGCCHAGLLNTLAHSQRVFGKNIFAILGGSHLVNASPEMLAIVIDRLQTLNQENPPQIYLNHCTGERAFLALARAFGELAQTCPAGLSLDF